MFRLFKDGGQFFVRAYSSDLAIIAKNIGINVVTVRPGHGTMVHIRLREERGVFEICRQWPLWILEQRRQINVADIPIFKHRPQAIAACRAYCYDGIAISHTNSVSQRGNRKHRQVRSCPIPIVLQFSLRQLVPFANHSPSPRRQAASIYRAGANVNQNFFVSITRMKVRRRMVVCIHLNRNSIKSGNFRHFICLIC